MKRKLFLVFIGCLYVLFAFPQNDPNKVLAEAQRKIDSVMKNNPALKKYADKSNQANSPVNIPNMPANVSLADAFARKPDTAFLSKIKIPDRNAKALASIPSKPMAKKELSGFIADMKKKIMTAIGSSMGTTALQVSDIGSDALSNGSVMCWYSGNTERALELALDAAEKDPDNLNALDNLSGILNMCGFPYKAVPILDYVSQQDPGNSTVNNNLGQAYIQMGDAQKAEMYLKKAIADYQYHPHANFTLACIEYANGNKGAAQGYCENCLRGAYIGNAWTMLKAINPKAKLMELIRHRFKQPDFFNPHKYPLLEQCRKPEDAQKMLEQYTQYKNMLLAVKDKYQRLLKGEQDDIKKNLAAEVMKKASQQQNPFRPFGAFAVVVVGDIDESHGDDLMRLIKYDSGYTEQMKTSKDDYNKAQQQVMDRFKNRLDKVGEGNPDPTLDKEICDAENEVAAHYLVDFANLNEERQQKWITLTKDYYNDYSYWCYIASLDDHQYHQYFYQLVIEYLNMLYKLSNSEFLSCKGHYTYTKDKSEELGFKEGKCPFEAKIDVEIENEETGKKETPAKFEIDCEKFSGEFDLGIASFHIKTTHGGATTIAFTAGLSKKIGKILPVSVSGEMGVSLTFGGGQPADIGIAWDYGMKLPGGIGGKNTAGWSVSLNSGVEFHGKGKIVDYTSDWASKNIFGLDPPAQQQNKNINLYNH